MLYVTDPMCSWCWGFSPVMEEIRRSYRDRVRIEVWVGGLRPGNTERFDEHKREYILGHWKAVHQRTGQPFNFSFQMGQDFTYDTEPPSRAVLSVRQVQPQEEFPFLQDIHRAFYLYNLDVTKEKVLTDLAGSRGIDTVKFREAFQDIEMKRRVWKEFEECRALGVTGFPTLLGSQGVGYRVLTQGYQSFQALTPIIESWLKQEID